MTRLEAIKRLEWLATETTGDIAGEQGDYAEFLLKVIDALDMAIAALREWDAKDTNVITNADHIRSMTDEELAEFLMGNICGKVSPKDFDCYGACVDCATIWLKQPYKEDT